MEILTRSAAFEPSTYNAESRTIQCVFATGVDVMRQDFEGPFVERLAMDAEAVDLSSLPGAPVLDSHQRFSIRDILGTVEGAKLEGGKGIATIRFGKRAEVDGLVQDIEGGIIRSVSAGYTVSKWENGKRADGVRVKLATRWTPKEISFTPLAADPQARTRSMEEPPMNTQEQFRSIAQAVGVPVAFADDLATRSATIEDARASIIREAARLIPPIDNRQPAFAIRDGGDNLVERMADGLRARFNLNHKPTEGREFATMALSELARRCLDRAGLSTLGTRSELITRAMHTTSDFPAILQSAMNKELIGLKVSPSPILQVFKRATADDFRARHVLEISDGSGLLKVNESGEIKFGTVKDAELASYSIASYARAFSISFQALVNDDMGALSDLSAKMTRGARQWFDGLLVDTIIANPKLADNKAVFHVDHANLAGTGAVPSEATIGAAKLGMRVQKDLSGNPINATPKFIVIPAALETTVDKLLATLYPQQPSDAVVSTRNLTPVVEPRFDAKSQAVAWYLFADPADAPVFEYCELSGLEGPQVEVQQGFRTLGTELRVVWHVGAGAIDSRGAWKNPGV